MTISIKHEMIVFWTAFLSGQIICVLFDFFRTLRKNTKNSKTSVAIEDMLFCTIAFKIFFDTCYITNNGAMRWYIFAAYILSAIIYFCTESMYVIKLWNIIFKISKFFISPVIKIFVAVMSFFKKLFFGAKTRIIRFFGSSKDKFRQIAIKKHTKRHKNNDLI